MIKSRYANCYETSAGCSNSWLHFGLVGETEEYEYVIDYYGTSYNSKAINVIKLDGSSGRTWQYESGITRPVFYLLPTVNIVNGDGTSGNPFIIENETEKENS